MSAPETRLIFLAGLASALLLPLPALAHCPLCTAGAGIAAVAAVWLGVSPMSVGVFVGAFAAALGLWLGRLPKKNYIPRQKEVLALLSFATTIAPLSPLIPDYSSVYVSLAGDYGSLLNRTYVFNRFVLGGILGGLIILLAPAASRALSRARGRAFPYQGMAITFLLLLLWAAVIELVL